jgi:hypothetical protein
MTKIILSGLLKEAQLLSIYINSSPLPGVDKRRRIISTSGNGQEFANLLPNYNGTRFV